MGLYAIGIGGTGAKCVESLIHMSAAGLLPDGESLYVLFVDPDRSNGNLSRTETLLKTYSNCRNDRVGTSSLLKTDVKVADPDVWSPLSGPNKLGEYFFLSSLRNSHPELADVFEILYTPSEIETSLDQGFRGHPSIGAAVMASSVDFDSKEPWRTFWEMVSTDIHSGKNASVMLFGSIFGGTGASGFPTIGRLLRKRFGTTNDGGKLRLGGALMLPYFSFDAVRGNVLKADSQDFLLNTKAALHYYHQREMSNFLSEDGKTFDVTYLIGCPDQRAMRTSELGGEQQKNDPHFAELYAALGAVEFFSADEFDSDRPYRFVARRDDRSLRYGDLPAEKPNLLADRLNSLARFSFAYLSTYFPMLQSIANGDRKSYVAPWYVQFFDSRGVRAQDRMQKELDPMRLYCEEYLDWLANIEFSINGTATTSGNLIEFSSFAFAGEENGKVKVQLHGKGNGRVFDLGGFEKMRVGGIDDKHLTLPALWERMSESYPLGHHRNAWEFFDALYTNCSNEFPKKEA